LGDIESSGAEFRPTLSTCKTRRSRPVGDSDYKAQIRGILLRSRKPRRVTSKNSISSDGDDLPESRNCYVEDILLEARRADGREMYFCLWGGVGQTEASWVTSTDMNKSLRDWWFLERESRYPLFRQDDFVSYEHCLELIKSDFVDDEKSNPSGDNIPLSFIDSLGRQKNIIFSVSPSEGESAEESELFFRGERAYYVKKIIDSRINNSCKEYLVVWEGYDTPTWIPEDNINDVALQAYKKHNKD